MLNNFTDLYGGAWR